MEGGHRAEVGGDHGHLGKGRREGLWGRLLRSKTVTFQAGSVGRYRTFPEALSREANTGSR